MSAVDLPPERLSSRSGDSGGTGSTGGTPAGALQQTIRSSALWSVLVCIVLGALSAAVLPTVPSYDPWSWIVWGREITDPHISFVISGGPSWKPLPFVFTTVWGAFGNAAPTLWVITARIGGLLGLVAAWRLAYKLAAGGTRAEGGAGTTGTVRTGALSGPTAGIVAGVIAVAAVLLTQDWFYYFLHGTSETMLVGVTLWAVDRMVEGKRIQAFWLMVIASLIRPEWVPLEFLYAAYLVWREPRFRTWPMIAMFVSGLALFPIAWFVPPWIGSGDAFLAASHASEYNGNLGPHPFVAVNSRGINDQVLPILVLGIAGVLIGWLRDRRRLVLVLGLAVVIYYVVVVVETLKGYPGLERFFLPDASLICVLGGYGIVRIAQLAGELVSGRSGASGAGNAATVAAVGVLAVLAGASVPFMTTRISEAHDAFPQASLAVTTSNQMTKVAAAVGGRNGVFPCKTSFSAVNHGVQSEMAWKLRVPLERVGTRMTQPGVDFIGPHNSVTGSAAPVDPRLTRHEVLARVDGWLAVRQTTPGLPQACDGR
jgi:hypothetical protein